MVKKRYLKDYTRDEKGSLSYTGKFYRSAISDADRKKHSLIGGVLGIMILLFALSLNCIGTVSIQVILPLEFTLLCYGYYLSGIAVFSKADNRMELRTYEGAFLRTIQSVTLAMVLQIVSLLGEGWIIFTTGGGTGRKEYYLLLSIAFVLMLSMFLWNRNRRLIAQVREENQNT